MGRVLIPISFGAVLGGTTTLIGTAPNFLVASYFNEGPHAGTDRIGVLDFAPIGVLFDFLILPGQIQNMAIVFLPGDGGERGSFYVNATIPASQVPLLPPTTGRYEDSILEDLIPFVENEILQGRIRQ